VRVADPGAAGELEQEKPQKGNTKCRRLAVAWDEWGRKDAILGRRGRTLLLVGGVGPLGMSYLLDVASGCRGVVR
jgi:hypothetical protein